jgi:translation initiation factor RLI1
MPGKMALLDFNKSRPDKCGDGVCKATLECPLHRIGQEGLYEIPMTDPFSCKGCGTCVLACPLRALAVIRM